MTDKQQKPLTTEIEAIRAVDLAVHDMDYDQCRRIFTYVMARKEADAKDARAAQIADGVRDGLGAIAESLEAAANECECDECRARRERQIN